jgi:NAD(P)-dependent dehydrogenase (short-subunit alcohol dehydrogenase family)
MVDFSQYRDKGVLVTGGANGLGLALVESFANAGARVFVADIVEDSVNAVVARLSASGVVCIGSKCDVTKADEVEAALDKAWEAIGPIDLLCNNAGVVKPGALLEASQEDINWQFDVNVWSILNMTKTYVKRLRQASRAGYILITASEHSLSYPSYTKEFLPQVYNMSKHAVLSMAVLLREELKNDKVGISVLCPGAIATNIAQNSAMIRSVKFGASTPAEGSDVSMEALDLLAQRTKSAEEIVAIAVEGLIKQLFYIPTHEHSREDVDIRYRELQSSFDSLSL